MVGDGERARDVGDCLGDPQSVRAEFVERSDGSEHEGRAIAVLLDDENTPPIWLVEGVDDLQVLRRLRWT